MSDPRLQVRALLQLIEDSGRGRKMNRRSSRGPNFKTAGGAERIGAEIGFEVIVLTVIIGVLREGRL